MPDPNLSGQTILMLGGVIGGVCGITIVSLRIVEKLIDKRSSNGNGSVRHRDFVILHEDVKEIDSDMKDCSSKMAELHRAADGFSNSHVMLKELLTEIVVGNRAYHQQFSIFLEQFSSHMRDFRCLGLAQSDKEDDK